MMKPRKVTKIQRSGPDVNSALSKDSGYYDEVASKDGKATTQNDENTGNTSKLNEEPSSLIPHGQTFSEHYRDHHKTQEMLANTSHDDKVRHLMALVDHLESANKDNAAEENSEGEA